MSSKDFPWLDRDGQPVACVEKVRVLRENDAELRQTLQDAFEDGILMGVSPDAMRKSFIAMLADLVDPKSQGNA